MAYNRWTFYGQSEELKHYGVLGMRWGVRKARYYERKAQKYKRLTETAQGSDRDAYAQRSSDYERRRQAVVEKLRRKSTEKLSKYDTSYKKWQGRADRKYSSAQRKQYGFLANETKANKTYDKASKDQYRANKVAYRGKRFYDEMVKAYGQLEIKMDSDYSKLGKEFIDRVENQSRVIYATSAKRRR